MESNATSSSKDTSLPLLCSKDYDSSSASEIGDNIQTSSGGKTEACSEVASSDQPNTKEVSEKAPARSGSSSPDLHCPICLGQLENRSYTDTCFHKFCFVCLVEWSKVKAVCPLCKQPFTSVIHSVRSYDDFEQLSVSRIADRGIGNSNASNGRDRFRYQTTVVDGTSLRRQQEQELLQRPSRYRHRGQSRFDPPPAFTSSFRRAIYRDSLWVQTINGLNRYRDVSAAFFSRNPACMHRLVPWLNRELMALLRNANDVSFMMDVIMDCVKRFDIGSDSFHTLVLPFFGARTRHFMHEFNSFARSPFDMAAYDARAVYARVPQDADADLVVPIEFGDSSSHHSESSDDDSDIIEIPAVENKTIQSTLSLLHPTPERAVSREKHSVHLVDERLKKGRSSPVAGPSRSRHDQSRQNVATNESECFESDDEIEVLAVDKPWQERSPIVLSSTSDSELESSQEADSRPCDKSVVSLTRDEQNVTYLDAEDDLVSIESSEVSLSVETHSKHRSGSCQGKIESRRKKHKRRQNGHHGDEVGSEKSKKLRRIDKENTKYKHRHDRHRHHRHAYTRNELNASHVEVIDDDSNIGSHKSAEEKCRPTYRSREASSSAASTCKVFEANDDKSVSSERSSIKSFVSVPTAMQDPVHIAVQQATTEQWVSENSSDDDGTFTTPSHSIRSTVVVPSISKFKKHSSGHKHSELSLPS